MLQSSLLLDIPGAMLVKNQSYKVSSIQCVYLCALPQSHQERAYQEFCASKAMEKAQEQETYYQQSMAVHTTEISSKFKFFILI